MLGAMAYADREYRKLLNRILKNTRFPPASEEVLGKRRDRYVDEVKKSCRPLPLNWPFAKTREISPTSIPPVSTPRR